MGGMFFDSGRLYHSSLRTYPSSGCMVCKDSHVIRTAAEPECSATNQVSTLCAGAYVSDCNSAGPAHT